MTEADWLSCQKILRLVGLLGDGCVCGHHVHAGSCRQGDCPCEKYTPLEVSPRKLRLFAAACCREAWSSIKDEKARLAVLVAEWYADGGSGDGIHCPHFPDAVMTDLGYLQMAGLQARATAGYYLPPWYPYYATREDITQGVRDIALGGRGAVLAPLFRDIVGNPWWTPSYPTLQSREAQGLALAAYEARREEGGQLDPFRLALVADALEDAGSQEEALLRHLRGWEPAPPGSYRCRNCGRYFHRVHKYSGCGNPVAAEAAECDGADADEVVWMPLRGPHVRGCWALDLTLGKV